MTTICKVNTTIENQRGGVYDHNLKGKHNNVLGYIHNVFGVYDHNLKGKHNLYFDIDKPLNGVYDYNLKGKHNTNCENVNDLKVFMTTIYKVNITFFFSKYSTMNEKFNYRYEDHRSNWQNFPEIYEMEWTRTLKLYWVEESNSCEDWFVVSNCYENAEDYLLISEGMDTDIDGDDHARALPICIIPDELIKKYKLKQLTRCNDIKGVRGVWAQIELLKELGFDIIENEVPRVVKIHNHIFKEGDLSSQVLFRHTLKKEDRLN